MENLINRFSKFGVIMMFAISICMAGSTYSSIKTIYTGTPGWGGFKNTHQNDLACITLGNDKILYIDPNQQNAKTFLALAMLYYTNGDNVSFYYDDTNYYITLMGK
jgi:hypothetical protein